MIWHCETRGPSTPPSANNRIGRHPYNTDDGDRESGSIQGSDIFANVKVLVTRFRGFADGKNLNCEEIRK